LVQPTWELGWDLSKVELKLNAQEREREREVIIPSFHILFPFPQMVKSWSERRRKGGATRVSHIT